MNNFPGRINRRIQSMMFLFILLIASIYLGLLVSLHFVWYPQWDFVTPGNIDVDFNEPVNRAVRIFKPLVIILIVCSAILIVIDRKETGKLLPITLFVLIIAFAFISAKYILPLHTELKMAKNEVFIREKLLLWMRYNDYRMYLIIFIWLVTFGLILKRKNRSKVITGSTVV